MDMDTIASRKRRRIDDDDYFSSVIELKSCRFGSSTKDDLVRHLHNNHMEELRLVETPPESLGQWMKDKHVVEGLKWYSGSLRKLSLSMPALDEEAAMRFAMAIPPNLKELRLDTIRIDDKGLWAIARRLPSHRKIEKVALESARLNGTKGGALGFMVSGNRHIRSLTVHAAMSQDFLAGFARETDGKSNGLRELRLEKAALSDHLEDLSHYVVWPGLPEAGLTLSPSEMSWLNHDLRVLSLSGIEVSNEAALLIARALATNAMTELSLVDAKMKDQGVLSICSALHKNESLELLDIGGSNCPYNILVAVTSILEVLRAPNKTLREVKFKSYSDYFNEALDEMMKDVMYRLLENRIDAAITDTRFTLWSLQPTFRFMFEPDCIFRYVRARVNLFDRHLVQEG